jgi:hypothetical protein
VSSGPGANAAVAVPARRWDRVALWWRCRAPWQHVLIVYAVTRLVAFVIVERTGRFQATSLWTPTADPGYLDMVDNWDGDWYRRVAESGYPADVPRASVSGNARQNAWAFYPLFPFLGRALMEATGLGWAAAGSAIALLCGAAAVVVMRSLVEAVAGPRLALWTVVLFCCFPPAPALQLAYSESLATLLLVGVLWCLQHGRYLPAVPLVLLVGVARPIGVPLAAVIATHVLRTWRAGRPPPRATAAQGALAAAAVAGALAWPAIAAVATGEPSAYTDTMAAWRSNAEVVPLLPWWWISRYLLGATFGPVVLVVLVGCLAWWLTRPVARCIAGDLRTWVVCYVGYLLVVLDPSTSLPRYLLLAFPLGTLTAACSPSRAYRAAVALAFLAGQVVWVVWLWRFVPPSDWPP